MKFLLVLVFLNTTSGDARMMKLTSMDNESKCVAAIDKVNEGIWEKVRTGKLALPEGVQVRAACVAPIFGPQA